MKTICPHCYQEYPDTPDEYQGQNCECPACHKNFIIEKVRFCQDCGTANAAQAVQCRQCGTSFAPASSPSASAPASGSEKGEAAPAPEPEQEASSENPLFEQAYAAMEAGDWEAAKELVAELLEEEPHNGYSHFYRLMVECRWDFCAIPDISRQHSFRMAKKYADETLSNTLKEIENVRRQWERELKARPDRWEELEQELLASSADGKDRALLQYVLDSE